MGEGDRFPGWFTRENVDKFDAVKARLSNDPSLDAETAIQQVQSDYGQDYDNNY